MHGRHAHLIELNPDFADIARERIQSNITDELTV